MWWSLPLFQEDDQLTLLINISWLSVTKCHPYIYLHFNSTMSNTNNIPSDHRFIEALADLREKEKREGEQLEGDNNICFNNALNAELDL